MTLKEAAAQLGVIEDFENESGQIVVRKEMHLKAAPAQRKHGHTERI